MLVLDSTIGCIEASEAEVLDLYRSAPLIMNSGVGSNPAIIEAYVCSIKKKTQVKVYLAFVADDRRIYVYTKPGKSDGDDECQRIVQEALGCARSMGFSPAPVDLNYSPAMREVVVRNTKVLRPPGSKIGAYLKHGTSGAPTLPLAKTQPPARQQTSAMPQKAVPRTAAPPVAVTTAAAAPSSASPRSPGSPGGEPKTADKPALAQLNKELHEIADEREAQAVKLQQLSALHQAVAAELAGAREECTRVTAERDELAARHKFAMAGLAAEKDALTEKLRELDALHRMATMELSTVRDDFAQLAAERDALEKSAHGAKKTSSSLAALQKEMAELSKRNEETNRRNLELVAESADRAKILDRSRMKAESLAVELDAALKRAEHLAGENNAARAQSETARKEFDALSVEKEKALGRIEALESQKSATKVELDALRRELARLADEHKLLKEENRALSSLETATLDAGRSATADFELPESNGLPEFPACKPAAQNAEDTASSPSPEAPDCTPFGDLNDDFFSPADDETAPGRFLLHAGMSTIEYFRPDEVVELHQSINNAYLSPAGKGQESCQGYICGLKREGSMQVLAAILGLQSGQTSVYLPEVQPEDESAYARIVKEAISFAEEVGLMMEPVQLGSSALQLNECLKRCPVLKNAERK